MKKLLIILMMLLIGCSKSTDNSSTCIDALKNPRLDFIADTIADIKAKPDLSEEDYKYIKQLQDEENAIWRSAQSGC
jgi:hypothetical protein